MIIHKKNPASAGFFLCSNETAKNIDKANRVLKTAGIAKFGK